MSTWPINFSRSDDMASFVLWFGAFILVSSPFIFSVTLKLIKNEKDRVCQFFMPGETPWRMGYARLLDALSKAFDSFFGSAPYGRRAFNRCLVLAFNYPFVALLIGLVINQEISNAVLFIAMYTALNGAIVVFRLTRRLNRWMTKRNDLKSWQIPWTVIAYCSGYLLLGVIGIVVTGGLAEAQVHAIGLDDDVSGVGAITAGLVLAFAMALAGTGAGAIAVALVGAGSLFLAGVISLALTASGVLAQAGAAAIITFVFLFLVVPALNAAFDWSSWGASRWLMHRLKTNAESGTWSVKISHTLLVVALAVFFLAVLTVCSANLLQVFDTLTYQSWHHLSLLASAKTDPFGDGFWISIMLLSTLVPAAIHLSAAFGALIVLPSVLLKLPLMYLKDHNPSTFERWITAGYITGWILISLSIVTVLLGAFIYAPIIYGMSLWTLIFDLADYLVFIGK